MSYVTNPIANRLGIQQGWHNPLISLRSGLTNISFITYLKCYLLMQEYLRYNQINLVFFEIKPLQKNKKLIHLFVYKNILHLVKNELAFDSRQELTKNGFLQLALYLSQKKVKLHQFKSKKKYKIRCYNFYNKNELANQSVALQLVLKQNLNRKKTLKKSKLKKHLRKLKSLDLVGIYAKQVTMKVQNLRKLFNFRKLAKYRPNVHKNKKYYTKKYLLRKIIKNHFLNSRKWKRNHNKKKKKKWWLRNRKAKRKLWFRKHQAKLRKRRFRTHKTKQKPVRLKVSKTRRLRPYTKKINKLRLFNRKLRRARKLLALYTKLITLNATTQKRIPKKIEWSNQKYFVKFLKKYTLHFFKNKKAVGQKKKNKRREQKWWLIKPYSKKKNKTIFRTQNNKFAARLQIKKWLDLKRFFGDHKQLQKIRSHRKKFKNMRHLSWKYPFFQPIMPKLAHSLFHFKFGPKFFRDWLWKGFEKSTSANPFQFAFFIKSYIARKRKRTQNLKLRHIQFNKSFGKRKKIKLVLGNLASYNLKVKKQSTLQGTENPSTFTRYISFINTYQNQQKFSKLNSIKLISRKSSARVKKLVRPRFYFRNFDSKFQKLNIELQFFIEKYIQKYLQFPVIAKIKNVSNFVDLRSNQKKTDYTRQVFLKPLAGKNFFIRLLHALLNTERVFHPQLFIDLIATEMQKTNNYRKLVNNMIWMFSVLHSEHIMGYKILIDGKLGGSKQKSTKQIFKLQNKEKIPIQTFTKNISYALGVARTPAGLFGIRMWLYY